MKWIGRDKEDWTPWFAWRPVRIGGLWHWLEWVERTGWTPFADYREYVE